MSFGQLIALLTFVLSMGTIAVTYAVGTAQETAVLCNPFLTGCTDITHTGMKGDAGFIFRGGMITASAFMMVWWWVMRSWLLPHSHRMALNVMTGLGILGAIGLIVGTAVLLPEKSDSPWRLHVQGANVYFQGTIIAIIISYVLIYRAQKSGWSVPSYRFKSFLLIGLLVMSVLVEGAAVTVNMSHKARIIEWWGTLFVGLYFLSSYWDWRGVRLVSHDTD
ncbi:MAG: hypothetical protein IBX52_06515 [Bacterioplanes sp.]|nr:hypothetical protein [Bacterioplanes sp.]